VAKDFKPGALEASLGGALLVWIALRYFGGFPLLELFALVIAGVLGLAEAITLGRIFSRAILWRLRNRIIVVYLLIAILPAGLLALLAYNGSRFVAGQVAVYMVHTELERRLNVISSLAKNVLETPAQEREAFLENAVRFYQDRYPGLHFAVPQEAAAGLPDGRGVLVKKGLLYCWSHAQRNEESVTLLVPITRHFLSTLVPNLGTVSIVDSDAGGRRVLLRNHESEDEEPNGIAPAVNRLDFELTWGSKMSVTLDEAPDKPIEALLAVHTRLSSVLRPVFALQTESPLVLTIPLLAMVLVAIYILSFYAGVSLTREITAAVHDLYDGTARVMRGDFAHRIREKGTDQVADLSRSFNKMTAHVEHLLVVAKEKERLQAEMEIAHGVQSQLFPRSVPVQKHLELKAVCCPARMVSGDYYDYQPLEQGRIALVLGDVAGKGISAALLMANLQASLRSQLNHGETPPTSLMMSRINSQLYAGTAPEKYATFFLGLYDDASGKLTYTNAGHLPPLLIRNGKASMLSLNGTVVGIFPTVKYDESSLVLEAGDLLVAYTDGVTEPENEFGEMFGEERLTAILLQSAHLPLDAILTEIETAVRQFTGSPELQDDLTLLIARRLP
jgi:sigma-B regulation protein RsbU (phosphoserine phosphatase)